MFVSFFSLWHMLMSLCDRACTSSERLDCRYSILLKDRTRFLDRMNLEQLGLYSCRHNTLEHMCRIHYLPVLQIWTRWSRLLYSVYDLRIRWAPKSQFERDLKEYMVKLNKWKMQIWSNSHTLITTIPIYSWITFMNITPITKC